MNTSCKLQPNTNNYIWFFIRLRAYQKKKKKKKYKQKEENKEEEKTWGEANIL